MYSEFSLSENERYSRQFLLSEIGKEGQLKLKNAKVLVVGAGGLGVPLLQYLAAAGVGKVGIIDGDEVDLSNLHRQVLYSQEDVGKKKAVVAKEKLFQLNPEIEIVAYAEFLTAENALMIISGYHFVIDGSDNFPTRYLVNDACLKLNRPFISGAVYKFNGQVGVFNYKGGGSYRCLFPQPPKPEDQPECSEAGVLGVVPGLIGMMMANEAIKMICETGDTLSGRLMMVDFLTNTFHTISFQKDEEAVNEIRRSLLRSDNEYKSFCGFSEENIKEITAGELRRIMKNGSSYQLIDVREEFESDLPGIGGSLIPFSEVMRESHRLQKDCPVIFYCKMGLRSAIVIQRLQDRFGMKNLYNLKGGLQDFLKKASQ